MNVWIYNNNVKKFEFNSWLYEKAFIQELIQSVFENLP